MAIKVTPPSNPEPEHSNPVQQPPVINNNGLPVAPPRIEVTQETQGKNLDEELTLTSQLSASKIEQFEYKDVVLNNDGFSTRGGLTAEDVINNDYETHYKRFEEKVVEIKTYIQEILTQENKSKDVALARKNRNSEEYKEMKLLIEQMLVRYMSQNSNVLPKDAPIVISMVLNEMLGNGPIEPLWQDSRITEIMVNGPFRVRIEIDGKLITAKGVRFRNQEHLLDTIQQVLAPLNRVLDISHPFEDGRLPDNSRINATHPVISPKGPFLTIRRFPEKVFTVRTLVEYNAATEEMAAELAWLVNSAVSGLISGGTGSGKALTLDTKIPMAAGGMKTMGELKVGDMILGRDSKPTKVTGYFPQPEKEFNYEVTFSDGNKVVTDAEHLWLTTTRKARRLNSGGEVISTENILKTLRTTNGYNNHSVRTILEPVPYTTKELPIKPYLFGAWLSSSGENNLDVFDEFELNRIPDIYLYSSIEQRKKLLAGLLDFAGTAKHQKVTFSHKDSNLVSDFKQLVHSLGYQTTNTVKTVAVEEDEKLFSSSYYPTENPFKLTWQQEHYEGNEPQVSPVENNFERYIVSVEKVEWSPTACITVDNEDHLYLCTDAYIPTHNTSFLNALSGCIPDNESIITIEDNLELRLHPDRDVRALEARKSHQGEGSKGNVSIRDLVRNSLRMRPDRIVIGEIRDATALDLLNAANTGHDGSLTTLHASTVDGAMDRVVNLVLESGESDATQALSLLANGFDFIVQINRFEDGSRRVEEIAEIPQRLSTEAGKTVLRPVPIWKFVQDGLNDDNKIVGHYEKVGEWSENLYKKHRLNNRPKLTIEEVYALSDRAEDTIE